MSKTVTVYDGLLADILADPADDTPRLVLADWLEEFGDEKDRTRAEFVRVQCELAQFKRSVGAEHLPHAREEFLRARERELWEGWAHAGGGGENVNRNPFGLPCWGGMIHGIVHDRLTAGIDPAGHHSLLVRRGFVERLTLTGEELVRHAKKICACQPVTLVRLINRPTLKAHPTTPETYSVRGLWETARYEWNADLLLALLEKEFPGVTALLPHEWTQIDPHFAEGEGDAE